MDKEVTKFLSEFFGRSIQNQEAEEVGKDIIYSIKKNENTTLDYIFDRSIIEEIKKKLHKEDEALQINTGRQAYRLWLALIVLACEQNRKLKKDYKIKGSFTYSDIIRLLNVEKGGKTYKDIRDLFMTLASARFVTTRQIGSKEQVKVYSLINTATVTTEESQEDKTRIEFELNDTALGITTDFIIFGRLSKSIQKEGYLSIPISDLTEKEVDTNYLNFRERLRLFKGGRVSGQMLLIEWIKLTDIKLTRRNYCHKVVMDCLEKAKTAGELQDYAADTPLEKGWLEKWKFIIHKQ